MLAEQNARHNVKRAARCKETGGNMSRKQLSKSGRRMWSAAEKKTIVFVFVVKALCDAAVASMKLVYNQHVQTMQEARMNEDCQD